MRENAVTLDTQVAPTGWGKILIPAVGADIIRPLIPLDVPKMDIFTFLPVPQGEVPIVGALRNTIIKYF